MFDRPRDYDTASDNIVRVHASMFRKRLEQYFSTDGSDEPLLIEIPKGNYAPAFRRRAVPDSVPGVPVSAAPSLVPVPRRVLAPARRRDRRVLGLALVAAFFACCTLFLLLKPALKTTETDFAGKPSLRQFWSAVFHTGQRTDIVLDDAGVGLYQELSGRALGLSEYFDRSYLRGLNGSAGTKLDPSVAQSVVLRRQSNFASTTMLWRIWQVTSPFSERASLHFARDYSFRELKADNAILLGNSHSNPWIEPFEGRVGLRWKYDAAADVYYPLDSWAQPGEHGRFRSAAQTGEMRESYCMVALLPNLGGTGNIVIISGTGGAAVGAAGDFLSDESSVAQLRSRLPVGKPAKNSTFPLFEALLRIKSRNRLSREASIVICRPPRTL